VHTAKNSYANVLRIRCISTGAIPRTTIGTLQRYTPPQRSDKLAIRIGDGN